MILAIGGRWGLSAQTGNDGKMCAEWRVERAWARVDITFGLGSANLVDRIDEHCPGAV